jgi:O-antigen ligase
MRTFAALCLAGALWMWTWGMARGGADFASSLWQVQRVIYLPIFYFVFQLALRGRADRKALAKILVAAACFKAVLAVYLAATVSWPEDAGIGYATTHEDSMLFAGAACVLIAPLIERVDPRHLRLSLILLPLLVAGMIANTRRIVWVELGAGLAVIFWLTPWTRVKRVLARAAVLSSPLLLVYAVIGWSSTASVFEPVQIIRSIVDSDADLSTQWRDWENYNLIYTLRQHPLLGTGYGHAFIELVKLPDISESYALYRYIPHNAILGLWAFGGLFGFTALWTMLGVGIFLAARAYRHAAKGEDRTAALSVVAVIVIYFVHCYGDMGLGTWTSVFLVAPGLAVASQLAVITGAWKYPKRVVKERAEGSTSPPLTPALPALGPWGVA